MVFFSCIARALRIGCRTGGGSDYLREYRSFRRIIFVFHRRGDGLLYVVNTLLIELFSFLGR